MIRKSPGADPGLISGCCKILQKKIEHKNDVTCRKKTPEIKPKNWFSGSF